MKINIISDIHAVYEPKEDKVFYNLKPKYADCKYLAAAKQLLKFWSENIDVLKKKDFKPELIHESFP